MIRPLNKLWNDQRGANAAEYALLLLLISLIALAGMRGVTTNLGHAYTRASSQVLPTPGSLQSLNTADLDEAAPNQARPERKVESVTPGGGGGLVVEPLSQPERTPR